MTYALATQLVVSLPGGLSEDAARDLEAIWAELAEFGRNIEDVPLADLRARLTDFESRILAVVRTEGVPVDGAGTGAPDQGAGDAGPTGSSVTDGASRTAGPTGEQTEGSTGSTSGAEETSSGPTETAAPVSSSSEPAETSTSPTSSSPSG